MKGIVFNELLDMIEKAHGADMVDDILEACDLESGGAYTSVGTYDHRELLAIVGALGQRTGKTAKDLTQAYGEHLFGRFFEMMPQFFEKPRSAFEFLESVHDYIHVEVRKLYPDASLPEFETEKSGDEFIMRYKSRCPFADFAQGLIQGCIGHYKENISINSEDNNDGEKYCRIFRLRKQ